MNLVRITKNDYIKWIPLVLDYIKEIKSMDEFKKPEEDSIKNYIDSFIGESKFVFCGLEDNDKPIAFISGILIDQYPWNAKKRAWISALYVIPEFRKKKNMYFKKLTDAIEKYLKNKGVNLIEGIVNIEKKNLKRFWNKLGCKETGIIYSKELKEN